MSGACARCRLRAFLQQQTHSRQRRQCFSASSRRRQDAQETESVDSLYQKFDRSLHQSSRTGRGLRGTPRGDAVPQRAGAGGSVGRYSRQPVERQPGPPGSSTSAYGQRYGTRDYERHNGPRDTQQNPQALIGDLSPSQHRHPLRGRHDEVYQEVAEVLQDLNAHAAPDAVRSPTCDPAMRRMSNVSRRALPPKVIKAAEKFMNAADDQSKWTSLQELLHRSNVSELRWLGERGPEFGGPHFVFSIKMTEAYIRATSSAGVTNAQDLPKPSVLLAIRTALGDKQSTLWPTVLWKLACHVASLRLRQDETVQDAARLGMDELMRVWSLYMKSQLSKAHENVDEPRNGAASPTATMLLETPLTEFSMLPAAAFFREAMTESGNHHELSQILGLLLPQASLSTRAGDSDVPSAVLVTLNLLRNWEYEKPDSWNAWSALMQVALESTTEKTAPHALRIAKADAQDVRIKEYLQSVSDTFAPRASSLQSQQEDPNQEASQDSKHTLLQSISKPPALTEASTELDRFMIDAVKNLGRALEQDKLVYAKRTWQNIQQNAAKFASMQVPRFVYERLLVTFIALRDRTTVVELWKAMVKDGHQPDVKAYSIVMQGCRYVGDIPMLEGFWTTMRKAGVQPDSHAWSTRVFALLKGRQVDDGLRALGEMSQDWVVAARRVHENRAGKKAASLVKSAELAKSYTTDLEGVPRPNAAVMNTAVSALAAVKDDQIPRVLTWARSFSIEPDLVTYNALLNVAMRRGKADEAMHIFRRMDEKGIRADGSTWTVLLTALFEGGFLEGLDPAAQKEKVMAFVTSLEAANATAIDMKGYALLIDRLLKKYNNAAAADAVLRHMTSRSLQPTPHIYTILMTSHFSADPPNLQAIDALWSSMRSANSGHGVPLDSQFYDRMIEGYATHQGAAGGTKPMQIFLKRSFNEGKKPSWTALAAAIKAYAERGEWERAKALVGKVMREMESSRALGQRFGQRYFWRVVLEMGLVRAEDVPVGVELRARR